MKRAATITIKELHAHTGAHVRRAAKTAICVTDRGRLVAVLAAPHMLARRRPKRSLLPEYAALLRNFPETDVLAALASDRDR